jgi:hypothetical protein
MLFGYGVNAPDATVIQPVSELYLSHKQGYRDLPKIPTVKQAEGSHLGMDYGYPTSLQGY